MGEITIRQPQVFDDYVDYWKHNGFWLFDSPEIIHNLAQENSINLAGTMLFYYEVYEKEFDGEACDSVSLIWPLLIASFGPTFW